MPEDYRPNSLESQWMPFTDNRGFKNEPRLIVEAEGVFMKDHRGGTIIDGSSGLFCSPAGHCHPKIIEAVHKQMQKSTYVAPFGLGHPDAFELADRVTTMTPEGMNHVFFVNSGSEAIDTALKMIMAYHAAKGDDQRTRFVSRDRAYHGVNIGGVSLSGMVNNRKSFPATMPNVVHMRHTWDADQVKCQGQPEHGWPGPQGRWCRQLGIWSGCAKFVTPMVFFWCLMRLSPGLAAWARTSPAKSLV